MRPLHGRLGLLVLAAAVALAAASSDAPGAEAADPPRIEYTVEPAVYNNSLRVGAVSDVLYPRVAAGPSVANVSQENVYVLGLSSSSCSQLVVIRSVDGGETFEAPHATTGLCLGGLFADALVAPDGAVFVATHGPTFLRSLDDGLTWNKTASVPDEAGYVAIALDVATGRLHMGWLNPHDYLPYAPPVFRTSSSVDRGTTWTPPADVLSNATGVTAPQIAAASGKVAIGYVRQDADGQYVAVVSSSDDGLTWSNETALTAKGVPWQHSGPSAAASPGGALALTWYEDTRDLRNGTGGVWDDWGNATQTFASLSWDGGGTWSAPVHVGGPPGWVGYVTGGAAAFDPEGRLHVAWHSIGVNWTTSHVYVATSDRSLERFNTSAFETRVQVGGGNSTQQENLGAGPWGRVYLVWDAFDTPDQPGIEGIYVRTVTGAAEGSIDSASPTTLGSLELRDPATNATVARFAWHGTPIIATELPPETYDVWFDLGDGTVRAGTIPIASWGRTVFTVYPGGVPSTGPPPVAPFPWFLVGVLLGAVGIAGAALILLQYTRITKEDALQRKVRGLLHEYVHAHPGSSFSKVRDAVGLRNGAASYHLGVLERQGYLHSEGRRGRRWYYPNGDLTLWRDLPLSPLQASILEAIRAEPGIGVREIARAIDHRASSVTGSVKALAREGVLRTERSGRKLRCFPADGPMDA